MATRRYIELNQPPLIRPSFRTAIRWIAENDDTEWMADDDPVISVSAALVADLFGASEDRVIEALRRRLAKLETA